MPGEQTKKSKHPRSDEIDDSKRRREKKRKTHRESFATEECLATPLPERAREGIENESSSNPAPHVSMEKRKNQKKGKSNLQNTRAIVDAIIPSNIVAQDPQSAIDSYLSEHSITIHSTTKVLPILSFDQLKIPAGLVASLNGFTSPTPIQACTWPPALEGRDVVGIAETGSGKTLAFGIPAISRLLAHSPSSLVPHPPVSILILAPTRELALQTHSTLSSLANPFSIASVCLFGGVPKEPQIKRLKNANNDGMKTRIVVGTPGRILDLVNEGVCDLSHVTYLVLDEADRMLDKGFENDIRAIASRTRPGAERQTMMFSATWPDAVRRLANTFQRDPVRVTVGSDELTANCRIEQILEVFDDTRSKDNRLLNRLRSLLLKKDPGTDSLDTRILIFALYKKEASRVERMLRGRGFSVGALHGDMGQNDRMAALEDFRSGTTELLVATDVAARGLDIPNVKAVINYTFPLTIEDYVHRIGRTGRAGRSGKSITFFTGENHERSLAGELSRVLREGGFDKEADALREKFPMTIKKKTHSVYGAFFRDDVPVRKGPTRIVF